MPGFVCMGGVLSGVKGGMSLERESATPAKCACDWLNVLTCGFMVVKMIGCNRFPF